MRAITRRSALAAGFIATAGAGAVMTGSLSRGRRWLHSVGLVEGPDLTPPAVRIGVGYQELESRHMREPVAWGVARPAATAEALVLCLHGRGASEKFAFDSIGVHWFVTAAQLPWAVASVDGGESSYWHRRADGTDPQSMIFEDLLPTLTDQVGAVPLLLLGWSMGGYGALLAATDYPQTVRAVAATSPALWHSFADSAAGAFDGPTDFREHDLFARIETLRKARVRVDCGDDDPFIGTSRALAADLPDAESEFGEGFHNAASWRARVPEQLAFLGKALV